MKNNNRYIGLPVMLKAGEYSPNNPLVRGERPAGDALLGLGEYERRRNTLRKIRQQQYREYLDQQAKKKQEAKEQAERERREREQREREREERERELVLERDRFSPERRRSVPVTSPVHARARDAYAQYDREYVSAGVCTGSVNKVDTGVQVDGFTRPLSVAVQTDETELFRLSPSPSKSQLTQAERELSPRSVQAERWDHAPHEPQARRRSYGDFDERACLLKKCNRDKLTSDLRHTYMPSIFDADAIRLRNIQAEKEAAERRQYYQQELKNQIMEQQRIREERKTREKMLEQAEMRRLEEQLRMLRVAQEREVGKHHDITAAIKENTSEYNSKRTELQREIDMEHHKLLRVTSQPTKALSKRTTTTSKSDTQPSKLPFYYPKINNEEKKPYSMNIPDNSIFSSNYDVDSYLRRNLNFNKEKVFDGNDSESVEASERKVLGEKVNERKYENVYEKFDDKMYERQSKDKVYEDIKYGKINDKIYENRPNDLYETNIKDKQYERFESKDRQVLVAKALIHEQPIETDRPSEIVDKQPSRKVDNIDCIPVLRHSPQMSSKSTENCKMSDAMKKVDDKWQVPVVQKNILKALPNEEGKNVSILTQLGSIRRQLQLEQLKLDRMLSKDDT
ncbi:uncharacterized protein LOC142983024 isoform X2 [Anticarsia gemmatalis]|uniref:uncharacterized protein LOC142983024 isoform X2 n=1 Tax=Anticarsia gemmatalis TaxID=129554 RepID=UPI003F75C48B